VEQADTIIIAGKFYFLLEYIIASKLWIDV